MVRENVAAIATLLRGNPMYQLDGRNLLLCLGLWGVHSMVVTLLGGFVRVWAGRWLLGCLFGCRNQ